MQVYIQIHALTLTSRFHWSRHSTNLS